MFDKTDGYTSYKSLAPKYAFIGYRDGCRTTPGAFGARASKLYPLLADGKHHDVRLSLEEPHRIAVWLDSVSMFHGVYEPDGQQAELRGERARPTLE